MEVYFLISLIVITDGIILFCKFRYNRPHVFDKDLNPVLIIGSDYWDLLALPLIFVLPFVWLQNWLQAYKTLYFLPFSIISVLLLFSLIMLLRHRLKRYYFTDNGIVILNLFTNQFLIIPKDQVQGYSYKKSLRGSPAYLVVTTAKKFYFNIRQIKNLELFKEYFTKQNIPYYEFDWLTGHDYKSKH
jgi:hypothetical protein